MDSLAECLPHTHKRLHLDLHQPCSCAFWKPQHWKGRDRCTPKAHWLSSLAKSGAPGSVGDPASKTRVESDLGRHPHWSLSPTYTLMVMHVHPCAYTHNNLYTCIYQMPTLTSSFDIHTDGHSCAPACIHTHAYTSIQHTLTFIWNVLKL